MQKQQVRNCASFYSYLEVPYPKDLDTWMLGMTILENNNVCESLPTKNLTDVKKIGAIDFDHLRKL